MGKVYSSLTYIFSKPLSEAQKLFKAIQENDYNSLEEMVRIGANVAVRNDEGFTLLHYAAELGHHQCVDVLLFYNSVDVNAKDSTESPLGPFQTTALHLAAAEGWPRIVASLLDNGADVNATNITGWTPLHYMIVSENITSQKLDILSILIASGADLNIRDNEGKLPIHTAILYGHYEVTRLLLNSGIHLDSLESIDPNLIQRDDVYQCVELCVYAGGYKVIEKYDVIKYIIESSKSDEESDEEHLLLLERIERLLHLKYSAQSLKYLCRIAFRKCFSNDNLSLIIDKFLIPDSLQWYLLLRDTPPPSPLPLTLKCIT